ncbi:MFS transporter, MHS family, proline/betaine transporter [Microbacterium sp. cf046]|uniref:MFS transporter n=1 Tax=Microbacterium sp. cf046 TaxID=1761803 RepID=UPI0008E02EC7|nr:MFS transporter [Microbacterium sp. cf046]SFS16951.1 MFS transporter, MHS family, proline/betaine transporter [Microbacterium sp. cf046]
MALSGHVIEWFEFGIYGVLAAYIARAIFPSDDPVVGLALAWSAYAVAFIVRPLGGILLARVGDTYGRARSLFAGVLLMSIATFSMGVIPGWEAVGIVAPIAFTALRGLQGFAVGGEMASAVSFLLENSSRDRLVRSTGILAAGTFTATLVGSVLAAGLSLILDEDAMSSWGWRLLFLLSLPLANVALRIRGAAMSSEPEVATAPSTLSSSLRTSRGALAGVFSIGLLYNGGLAVALGGYLNHLLLSGYSRPEAIAVNSATYASLVGAILACHRTSTRLGVRRTIILSVALMPVALTFAMWAAQLGPGGAFAGGAVLAVPLGLLATPVYLLLGEGFPRAARLSSGGLAFNLSTAFAGTIPAVVLMAHMAGLSGGLPVALVVITAIAVVALALSPRWLSPSLSAHRYVRVPS